jgi:hypothetical protein
MSRSRGQAGDSKLGCILWTLLLVVGVMIGWKAIPVKIASSELYDFMVEQAKWAGSASEETLKKRILDKGRELDLPLDPRYVVCERPGDKVRMRVQFTVPLEFPGYTYNWEFDLKVDRSLYIF